jgi:UDP-N-acetylglucosamine:LPS N-acetylglucosamine transferase
MIAPANCTVANHLSTEDMQRAFEQSEFVISRCGYTTVMEVLASQKKAVLIPTPGQTEQEYLAKHLFKQQWCYCCLQDEDLLQHFKKAKAFEYKLPRFNTSSLEDAVNQDIVGKYQSKPLG